MRLPALGTIAAILLLAGCAGPPALEAPAPEEAAVAPSSDALDARFIRSDDGGFVFRLNRPAHIALFEVVPDRGIALVHPAHEGQARKQPPGNRWLKVRRTSVNKQRDWYFAESPGMLNQETPDVLKSQGMLFLVASEEPIDLSKIAAAGGIRNAIDDPAARHPYRATEQLIDVILPERSEGDWAVDSWMSDPPRTGRR